MTASFSYRKRTHPNSSLSGLVPPTPEPSFFFFFAKVRDYCPFNSPYSCFPHLCSFGPPAPALQVFLAHPQFSTEDAEPQHSHLWKPQPPQPSSLVQRALKVHHISKARRKSWATVQCNSPDWSSSAVQSWSLPSQVAHTTPFTQESLPCSTDLCCLLVSTADEVCLPWPFVKQLLAMYNLLP